MINSAIEQVHGINIHIVWQVITPQQKQQLVEFWLKNGAIQSQQEAIRRTNEAVCLAFDADGGIAAVTTVYISKLSKLPHDYYFYRMFIRPDCRLPGLGRRLLGHTYSQLNRQFNAQQMALASESSDSKMIGLSSNIPKGLVFITENLKLKQPAVNRALIKRGFKLIGLMDINTAEEKQVWNQDFTVQTTH